MTVSKRFLFRFLFRKNRNSPLQRAQIAAKFFAVKNRVPAASKNKGFCLLIYPKHPKTTFFGCLSLEIARFSGLYYYVCCDVMKGIRRRRWRRSAGWPRRQGKTAELRPRYCGSSTPF
jgi:hypothetical protein